MKRSKPALNEGYRREEQDSTDTIGVRGAGATWQADFGMALNEADLLFSVRREPVANRIVFQIAHDVFDNWFRVEEVSEKPDPNFDREVQKVLSELNAKAVFTKMAVFERLFGWAIIAMTYVDYSASLEEPVVLPKAIEELFAYSTLNFTVDSTDEDKDPESSRFGLPVYYKLRARALTRPNATVISRDQLEERQLHQLSIALKQELLKEIREERHETTKQ